MEPMNVEFKEPACLTIYDPDSTPELMLKFRDLQSLWFMFQSQTFALTATIEKQHPRCEAGALDHQAARSRLERDLATTARIMFSAFLSTYTSLMDYANNSILKPEGHKWLANVRKKPLLTSLERLRNYEVHNHSLNALIGVRYLTDGFTTIPTSENPDVSHVHWKLLHEGPGLAIDALQDTEQFKRRSDLIKLLTDHSLLNLTHECVHELSRVFHDGIARGFLESEKAFLCWICRPRKAASVDSDGLSS